jgi:hypothetical protein
MDAPKYYLLRDGTILARVLDQPAGIAEIYGKDKGWTRADHVAAKVTGMGGDADFDEVGEPEAKKLFPTAFA